MYQLNSLLSRLVNVLTSPARLFTSGLSRLRALNPFRGMKGLWTSVKGLPQRILSPFAGPLSRLGIKINTGKAEKRDPRADLHDLFARDSERKSRKVIAQVARVSQVHLLSAEGQRYILHVGSASGRNASRLHMQVNNQPVQLHFAPTEPPDPRAPVRLTGVTGRLEVHVNNETARFPAPIRAGDMLVINGQSYNVELFFFDRTPIVSRVDASYATSTGPYRENNQDAIALGRGSDMYLFGIADGVGAGQDGDEVSAFAARYLLEAFYKNAPYDLLWPDVLATAFRHINAEVRAWLRRTPNPAGTTLTALVIKNWNAYIAHVGDTRVYLFRQNLLQQLTQDHMQRQPVEMATVVAMNTFEPAQQRDVLTRAIGKRDDISPDLLTLPLLPGDKILLTSDGLTNTLHMNEIIAVLSGGTAHAADQLVRRAIELEAKDNITAVVVECLAEAYVDEVWDIRPSDRVFTGHTRSWRLKLRKPGDPVTQVGPSPAGCFTLLLIIGLVAYWMLTR